jgi:hypothetical protein
MEWLVKTRSMGPKPDRVATTETAVIPKSRRIVGCFGPQAARGGAQYPGRLGPDLSADDAALRVIERIGANG